MIIGGVFDPILRHHEAHKRTSCIGGLWVVGDSWSSNSMPELHKTCTIEIGGLGGATTKHYEDRATTTIAIGGVDDPMLGHHVA